MRALLTVFAVALLVLATTVDRVACPDGCTEEGPQHAESSAPWVCGLCHGWSGPEPVRAAAPVARPAAPVPVPDDIDHTPHLPTIDHPPRVA